LGAALEMNGLSDCGVKVEPVRKGPRRSITAVTVAWWRKARRRIPGHAARAATAESRPHGAAEGHHPRDRAAAGPTASAFGGVSAGRSTGAVAEIDKPTGVPDPATTLKRVREQYAAERERERRMHAERQRREEASKPLFDDDD
jgi:hypothetical protein